MSTVATPSADVRQDAPVPCETGKRSFSSRRLARAARRKTRRKTIGVYQCDLCHDWHLTSRRRVR